MSVPAEQMPKSGFESGVREVEARLVQPRGLNTLAREQKRFSHLAEQHLDCECRHRK